MESVLAKQTGNSAYRPLLLVATAMAVGILCDRFVGASFGSHGLLVWWAIGTASVALGYLLLRSSRLTASTGAVLFAFVALAGAWHHLQWNWLEGNHLARFAVEHSEPTCVRAVVEERPQWTPAPPANPLSIVPQGSRSVVLVSLRGIRDKDEWREAVGECRLRVEGELAGIERGDQLLVYGQLGRPRSAMNPGQYQWAKAERGEGRFVELFCRVPQCVSVETSANFRFDEYLDRASRWCEHQISTYVGDTNRDLALALMLGQRERLPEQRFDAFLHTGTVHLLVVSGLHVGFLAGFLWLLVRTGVLSARSALFCSAALVVGYALVVGARPPVQRATILVLVTMVAVLIGRRSTRANILAAAAIMVLAFNPSELFRGGTQLSFLCVAAIAWYMGIAQRSDYVDPLEKMIAAYQPWQRQLLDRVVAWGVRLFQVSLVIWLVTAPLVAYHFNMAAPVSVLHH